MYRAIDLLELRAEVKSSPGGIGFNAEASDMIPYSTASPPGVSLIK